MTVNVKEGDRVRVVLEGDVSHVSLGGMIEVGTYHVNSIMPTAEHVVSVEVLAKQFKVGDTVEGDDYAKLPVGTIVDAKHHDAGPRVKVARDHWVVFSEGPSHPVTDGKLWDERVIKYLPDAA